jgi:hypothetical protein
MTNKSSARYAYIIFFQFPNCGIVIDGEIIFQEILDTASGKKTKSEHFGFGDIDCVLQFSILCPG